MLTEALQFAATWAVTPPAFRPFVSISSRLWARAGRCAKAWAPHEASCHAEILRSVASLRQRRTCVVLGSGLLRDVPIRQLAAAFDHVVLVDRVHVASVRVRMALPRYRHVQLISLDLSGFDSLSQGQHVEPLGFLRQVPYLDLVISANLLSQIGTAARRRITLNPSLYPEDLGRRLIRAHLDGLDHLACAALLLTDIRYAVIDRTGRLHDQVDMMFGEEMPPARMAWDWLLVPEGEESPDYRVVHHVLSVPLGRDRLGKAPKGNAQGDPSDD